VSSANTSYPFHGGGVNVCMFDGHVEWLRGPVATDKYHLH
jgi:prepilin-type processing-associated H-X9-DG protein